GTPPTYSGDADLSAVWTVIDELPDVGHRIVVCMKSTVPVGTGEKVRHRLDGRGLAHVGYVSNPEFTAEGTAVRDFMEPDRIVIGAFDEADGDAVAALHEGIDAPVVRADVASAEMIKLAANAALMVRISFINEIANVCEATGADVVKVAEGIGFDRRIGKSFLRAGIGFGGSCLAGDETVIIRRGGTTLLRTLERLYDETEPLSETEILTWRRDGEGPEFLPVDLLTRRHYNGDLLQLRTKMGRRVRCTPDHPFVVRDGTRVLAADLTTEHWLPLALGSTPPVRDRPRRLWVLEAVGDAISAGEVIVRPHADELAVVSSDELHAAVSLRHPRGRARGHDVARSGTLRLAEASELDIELADACLGTAKNGTYVPASLDSTVAFWRVVGLYAAEGHLSRDPKKGTQRLAWSFHPTSEETLVQEVATYWRSVGVSPTVYTAPTSRVVRISSRILGTWWVQHLGLGRNCYGQRVPDRLWDEPEEHKRAFLSGLWHGDGSWSLVGGGPSVILELGTASRELADGVQRLLGELGIVASVRVGRTSLSTVDTYWVRVSGADQVERMIELAKPADRDGILASIARQKKRITSTGFRRGDNAAWVRVVEVTRQPFSGFVYSLEVPPTHTFVTTGGLVTSNCFPKDSLALKQLAASSGYHFQVLNAVIEVNELQKRRVIGKLKQLVGSLRGRRVALLGLAFKPNTDDTRESPAFVLAGRLLAEGADVVAWDPVAHADGLHGVVEVASVAEALEGADAAVLVTEWPQLAHVDWASLAPRMRSAVLVDGRNMLDPAAMRAAGFTYDAIGRAAR
ncbi:MAG TPA: UDP binding domain-containing protein, partial [Gaiella sp.]|nr:UDP binding domain-containing protein [Gaiella sp.]